MNYGLLIALFLALIYVLTEVYYHFRVYKPTKINLMDIYCRKELIKRYGNKQLFVPLSPEMIQQNHETLTQCKHFKRPKDC